MFLSRKTSELVEKSECLIANLGNVLGSDHDLFQRLCCPDSNRKIPASYGNILFALSRVYTGATLLATNRMNVDNIILQQVV
jgi:hypothetical protein